MSFAITSLSQKYNLKIERLEASGFPGLKGIDQLPKRKPASLGREAAKKIPGMHKMAKIFRVLKAEMTGGNRDLRLGSYHLYAILRKVE